MCHLHNIYLHKEVLGSVTLSLSSPESLVERLYPKLTKTVLSLDGHFMDTAKYLRLSAVDCCICPCYKMETRLKLGPKYLGVLFLVRECHYWYSAQAIVMWPDVCQTNMSFQYVHSICHRSIYFYKSVYCEICIESHISKVQLHLINSTSGCYAFSLPVCLSTA